MKINLEVDCTPEEARRAMGLPDLTPLHDLYLSRLKETMEGGSPEMLDAIVKNWAPMGEVGMNFWKQMFDGTKTSG